MKVTIRIEEEGREPGTLVIENAKVDVWRETAESPNPDNSPWVAREATGYVMVMVTVRGVQAKRAD